MAYGESNGHMTDDVSEVLIVTSVCLIARETLSKNSHGIGQTPCSYERYLVFIANCATTAVCNLLL